MENEQDIVNKQSEYNKKYYSEHKESIKDKQGAKTECDVCRKMVTKWNMSCHKKSSHHLQALKIQELEQKVKQNDEYIIVRIPKTNIEEVKS